MGRIGFIPLLLATLSLASQAAAQNVLLVHDAGAAPRPAERRAILAARDLLGHFEQEVTVTATQGYRSHLLAGYDAVVYLGLRDGAELPEAFLADCYDLDRPLCWLGANLAQLAQRFSLGRYGFDIAEAPPEAPPTRVSYRGMPYWREEAPLPHVTVTEPQVCETIAVAVDSRGEQLPYAVRSRNLWYFPDIPLDSGRKGGTHLILCDQMHDFLGQAHNTVRTALLYVAAVTPHTDAGKLTALLRQLQREGVPFALEVDPLAPTTQPGQLLRLSRRRGLVGVLRGAQRAGASIIAAAPEPTLGRQAADSLDTGAESERAPTPADPARSMEAVLEELTHCGLYPLAGAVGPDLRPEGEASALAGLFSTVLEPEGVDGRPDALAMPFLILRDQHGLRVMPGNVPTLNQGRGEVEAMLEAARRQATVPDPFVTVGLAPEAPSRSVTLLVNGLRNMDYRFANLRHTSNLTKTQSLQIQTTGSPRLLADLLPEGWEATLLGPKPEAHLRFDRSDRDRQEETLVAPGALLISYPPGGEPKVVFSFEGDAQQVTQRMVHRIAHWVVIFALAASAILLLIYVFQAAQRRGARA